VLIEALADEVAHTGLTNLDPFDLLLHVAYNKPPLTRRERANRVKKRNVFTQYGPMARQVIDALLDKYADEGITTLEANNVLSLPPINQLGLPVELIRSFGGRPQYLQALNNLERELYAPTAP
jgi:type I restriction enzyme R subunit